MAAITKQELDGLTEIRDSMLDMARKTVSGPDYRLIDQANLVSAIIARFENRENITRGSPNVCRLCGQEIERIK